MVCQTLIDLDCSRRFRSNPRSLHIQHVQQSVIVLIKQDWSAGSLLQLHRATNVIDVRMSDDDLFELEWVMIEDGEDSLDLITRIDGKCFACSLVADDRAVTAEKADGEDLVNQDWTCRLNYPLPRMVPTTE